MPFSRKRKRRIIVGDEVWWCTTRHSSEYPARSFLVFRDDRKVTIRVDARVPKQRGVTVRVRAPELPWIPQGRAGSGRFVYPDDDLCRFWPHTLRRLIDWCLDPSVERVLHEPGAGDPGGDVRPGASAGRGP
jgi:hypothetical protein